MHGTNMDKMERAVVHRHGIGWCAHSVARKNGGRGDDDLEVGINLCTSRCEA
jgi:hypothetical protein